jgi:hypothetical protein
MLVDCCVYFLSLLCVTTACVACANNVLCNFCGPCREGRSPGKHRNRRGLNPRHVATSENSMCEAPAESMSPSRLRANSGYILCLPAGVSLHACNSNMQAVRFKYGNIFRLYYHIRITTELRSAKIKRGHRCRFCRPSRGSLRNSRGSLRNSRGSLRNTNRYRHLPRTCVNSTGKLRWLPLQYRLVTALNSRKIMR